MLATRPLVGTLAFLALSPLASAQFTNAVVPDFRGWEQTTYAGWDDWSGIGTPPFFAYPDDPASTAPNSAVYASNSAVNGLTASGGVVCTDGFPTITVGYAPPVASANRAIDEVIVQVKTGGGAPTSVVLQYVGFTGSPNPDPDYLAPVEFAQLAPDEFYYRFTSSQRGVPVGTFGEMQFFGALIDLAPTATPGCLDAVQIDVRHRLDGFAQPVCTPSQGNSLLVIAGTDVGGSSVASDNLIELSATGIPSASFGYFVASETLNMNPCTSNCPGTQGVSCMGGNPARIGPAMMAGEDHVFERMLDLTSIPTNPSSSVLAGSTWYFQAWYRDANPNVTSNFTSTAGVVFQ